MADKTGIEWIPSQNYTEFFKDLFRYVSGIKIGASFPAETWLLVSLVVIALIFSVHAIMKAEEDERTKHYIALFAWPILSIFIFIVIDKYFTNFLVIRYLGFIHIPIIIILSVGISALDHVNLRWAANMILIFTVVSALYFHALPFHKLGLKISGEPWAELMQDFCDAASKNSLVFTDRCEKVLDYYGKCYKGDVIVVPDSQINEAFFNKFDFAQKKHDQIFILYKNRQIRNIDWVIRHQADEIRKGNCGFIRLDLNR